MWNFVILPSYLTLIVDHILLFYYLFYILQDDLLDKHIAEGSFGGEVRSLGRPLKSLLVRLFFFHFLILYLFFSSIVELHV